MSERTRAGLVDPFGLVGTLLEGRYHVERVVGEGGFAVVYRARHLEFEAPVALKVLKSSFTPPGSEDALRAEGRILLHSYLWAGRDHHARRRKRLSCVRRVP